jgi:hypothetical protein
MAAAQRPLALAAGDETTQAAAWKTIRSWDVIGLADDAITPDQQLLWRTARTRRSPRSQTRRTSP